jgi:hypothetical protein
MLSSCRCNSIRNKETRPVLPALLALALLLAASLSLRAGEDVLFMFDSAQILTEEPATEDIAAASEFPMAAGQAHVTLGRRGESPSQSVKKVTLPTGEAALRMAPGVSDDPATPGHINFALHDSGLFSSHLDPSRPLFIEVKFQRSYGPISFSVQNLFRHEGEFIHAALGGLQGHLQSEGTYSAFSTCYTTPNDEVRGPDVPAEQTVTVRYEIAETAEGVTVKTGLFLGEELIFDTSAEPARVANIRLNEFSRLALGATSTAKATGEEYIDLISAKLWQ